MLFIDDSLGTLKLRAPCELAPLQDNRSLCARLTWVALFVLGLESYNLSLVRTDHLPPQHLVENLRLEKD